MFCRGRWLAAALAAALAGCGGRARPAVERVAVVGMENLTPAAELNLTGAVVAGVTVAALERSPEVYAYWAGSSNEAYLSRPTRLVVGYVTGEPERLELHAAERDAATGATRRRWTLRGRDAAELGNALAREIWRKAPVEEVPAEPGQALASLRERLRHEVPLEQAAEAAKKYPADARLAALAGRWAMIRRDLRGAGEWFDRALRLDPENGPLHNEAGYVLFYAGKLEEGLRSVEKYERLEPYSANPLDSRGEILLLGGRYREAEEAFVAAYERDPRFLLSGTLRKAAYARRLAGDEAGADQLFGRYLDAIAGTPLAELKRAQWDYETGREAKAVAALEQLNTSLARAQLAVWRRRAADAEAAMKLARGEMERAQAELARRVVSGEAGANTEVEALVLALRDEHERAIPALKAQIAALRPMEATQWEVLLGWAYAHQGREEEARQLIGRAPLPNPAFSLWEPTVMARYRELRAKLGVR